MMPKTLTLAITLTLALTLAITLIPEGNMKIKKTIFLKKKIITVKTKSVILAVKVKEGFQKEVSGDV
jgi:hypothetical protein